jgi:hypothetical protein
MLKLFPIMTKKLIYLWLTVAFTQFNLFAQNQEQIVVLPQTKGNLEGTLLIPQATKPMPVVLIIAGSGPQTVTAIILWA